MQHLDRSLGIDLVESTSMNLFRMVQTYRDTGDTAALLEIMVMANSIEGFARGLLERSVHEAGLS